MKQLIVASLAIAVAFCFLVAVAVLVGVFFHVATGVFFAFGLFFYVSVGVCFAVWVGEFGLRSAALTVTRWVAEVPRAGARRRLRTASLACRIA